MTLSVEFTDFFPSFTVSLRGLTVVVTVATTFSSIAVSNSGVAVNSFNLAATVALILALMRSLKLSTLLSEHLLEALQVMKKTAKNVTTTGITASMIDCEVILRKQGLID